MIIHRQPQPPQPLFPHPIMRRTSCYFVEGRWFPVSLHLMPQEEKGAKKLRPSRSVRFRRSWFVLFSNQVAEHPHGVGEVDALHHYVCMLFADLKIKVGEIPDASDTMFHQQIGHLLSEAGG